MLGDHLDADGMATRSSCAVCFDKTCVVHRDGRWAANELVVILANAPL